MGGYFNPHEVSFCAWLRDTKQLVSQKIEELSRVDIARLRKEYLDQLKKETEILDEHKQQLVKGERKKKYTLTKENFQQLIRLTFSVEVAKA